MLRIQVICIAAAVAATFGCGAGGASKSNTSTNSNAPAEIKLDPNNMPAGLSATPLPMPANGKLPEGITIDGAPPPPGRTPTPGIPSAEQLKKGLKPTAKSTPGIPDPDTIRKQLGYPSANVNVPAKGDIMMKGNRKLGGKPQ